MKDWLTAHPIAHRGYHDKTKGRAENSFSAFHAAVAAGFSIECDVQISGDGIPVVFHDPVLGRMTGEEGLVREHTIEQLADFRLLDTEDGVYSLEKHLDLVAGRVPVIIELKGVEGADRGLVEGVGECLANYDGPVAVMSFDHWLTDRFHEVMPDIRRGLTAEGGDEAYEIHLDAWRRGDLQFISYHIDELPCRFVTEMREQGAPVITWTVRTPEQIERTFEHADQMTFEGFDPRETQEKK